MDTTMSDNSVKLGQLASPEGGRDAVHVAVVAVCAGMPLMAGDCVRMDQKPTGEPIAISSTRNMAIGVVDPYLTNSLRSGEWFWLFLKPGTASNLRHTWAHPLFPNPEAGL